MNGPLPGWIWSRCERCNEHVKLDRAALIDPAQRQHSCGDGGTGYLVSIGDWHTGGGER